MITDYIKLIKVKNKEFVGFKFSNKQIQLFYPESLFLHLDNDDLLRKEIYALFKSFKLSLNAKVESNDKSPFELNGDICEYPLESYIFIIDDYLINGILTKKRKIERINGKGKINWKKTMKFTPYLNEDNTPFYIQTYNNEKITSYEKISEIYIFCVYEAIKKFGCWFYGLRENRIRTKYKSLNNQIKKMYIECLDNELSNTFNEDLRLKILNMKKIVVGAYDQNNHLCSMGISEYHSVYEKLIDNVFGNVNVDEYYPLAFWVKNDIKRDSSYLREDTIRITDGCAYIIDAKCYANDSYPDTSSIAKQIIYGEHLYENNEELIKKNPKRSFSKDRIYNFFIQPSKSAELGEKSIVYSGEYAITSWKTQDRSFEKVYLLYISMNKLLMNWAYNENVDFLKDFKGICNTIRKK